MLSEALGRVAWPLPLLSTTMRLPTALSGWRASYVSWSSFRTSGCTMFHNNSAVWSCICPDACCSQTRFRNHSKSSTQNGNSCLRENNAIKICRERTASETQRCPDRSEGGVFWATEPSHPLFRLDVTDVAWFVVWALVVSELPNAWPRKLMFGYSQVLQTGVIARHWCVKHWQHGDPVEWHGLWWRSKRYTVLFSSELVHLKSFGEADIDVAVWLQESVQNAGLKLSLTWLSLARMLKSGGGSHSLVVV